LANSPITLVSDDLLESPYRDGNMPLRILLSPPELNYDSFGQQSFGFKIENQLAEELRQFLDAYYPFNGKNRQTQLLGGAWVSKKFSKDSGIQTLHSQLKAVPTMVLESEVDSNYLNFRVAYWRGDGTEYQYKSILSGFPYRDFLYDSVRERARKWQAMKQLLLAKGKTPENVKAIGGDSEFNLFILQEEQQLLDEGFDLSNSDIQKQYKVSEKDFQKLHKYLITCHCLTASVIADIHYLGSGNNLTPLLPSLLEDLLKDVPDSDELQTTMLDWLLTIYNQMYEKLEEVMAGWIPELILQFAIVLTSLEDKSYAIQQGEQSVKAWLRLHGIETIDRKKLHSIVTKDDEPYFKSLQEFLEKVGTTDKLTEAKSLLEAWKILQELGVVKESPKVNVDDVPKPEPPEPELPGEEFSFEVVTVNSSGNITNRETKTNRQQIFDLGNGVELEMVYIPAGTFLMGAPSNEKDSSYDERPQHNVTLEAFWMAKYPITQTQYRAITGNNPSNFQGNNNPVELVSHDDAVAFCNQLSAKLGKTFQLPSEAQWEYACRAGTTTPFYFGETITGNLANYNASYTYAHESSGTYREQTTSVGNFPPNAFGLYDMHGNVCEWCADTWHDNYNGTPTDGSAWIDKISNTYVLRGGSWSYVPDNCRSAFRYRNARDYIGNLYGFRCLAVGTL
jgi:formylglycine-generating enzyme required for sulfatase activity